MASKEERLRRLANARRHYALANEHEHNVQMSKKKEHITINTTRGV